MSCPAWSRGCCMMCHVRDDHSALILACARAQRDIDNAEIKRLMKPVSDWRAVAKTATAHSVLPLLATRLTDAGIEVPAVIAETAAGAAARNLGLVGSLLRAQALLAEAGIETLAFKGPPLSVDLYGDFARRQSADIDLLVRRGQALDARRALQAADHRFWLDLTPAEERRFLRYSNEYGLWDPEGGIVELTWALAPRHLAIDLDADRFFADARSLEMAGTSISVLAPHDQLLALAVHGGKHLWERLGWVADVAQLIATTPDLDVDLALARARSVAAERHVLVAVAMCRELLGTELPRSLAGGIERDSEVPALTAALRDRLLPLPRRHPERVFEPLSLRLRERRRDQALTIARLIVTPTVEDWRWIRLPDALAFAYPTMRPVRLARKYLFS